MSVVTDLQKIVGQRVVSVDVTPSGWVVLRLTGCRLPDRIVALQWSAAKIEDVKE